MKYNFIEDRYSNQAIFEITDDLTKRRLIWLRDKLSHVKDLSKHYTELTSWHSTNFYLRGFHKSKWLTKEEVFTYIL